jgi:purine nucleosidase
MVSVTHCPLANNAIAFRKAPDIAPRVSDIVRMGGACFAVGYITPAAGFNTCVDPAAAQIVFAVGLPLVVTPPDVTPKALTPRTGVEEMRSFRTPVGQAIASWTDFFERFKTARYGSDGTPLQDPYVIASLPQPALSRDRHIDIQIETRGEFTLGMTVADCWRKTKRAPNAMVMGGVDREGLYRMLTERLGRGGEREGHGKKTLQPRSSTLA